MKSVRENNSEIIKENFFYVIGVQVEDDVLLEELDFTSLKRMMFMFEVEDAFGIEIDEKYILQINWNVTVSEIVATITNIVNEILASNR